MGLAYAFLYSLFLFGAVLACIVSASVFLPTGASPSVSSNVSDNSSDICAARVLTACRPIAAASPVAPIVITPSRRFCVASDASAIIPESPARLSAWIASSKLPPCLTAFVMINAAPLDTSNFSATWSIARSSCRRLVVPRVSVDIMPPSEPPSASPRLPSRAALGSLSKNSPSAAPNPDAVASAPLSAAPFPIWLSNVLPAT